MTDSFNEWTNEEQLTDHLNDERIVASTSIEDDEQLTLRPQYLNEYIGQTSLKEALTVYITAAKQRKEALDHALFYGPPGLGKTTLAFVIGNELGVNVRTTSGPAIEKTGDLIAILSELQAGDILFVDEIHRLPRQVEEVLYSAMEDFYVDIVAGTGASAQSIHYPLPPFTLIGATTRAGHLSAPLRDRFGIIERMNYYTHEELQIIVKRSATVFNSLIDDQAALEIAIRSRGTPRIANRLMKRIRDFSQVAKEDMISLQLARQSLRLLGVDQAGLDEVDRRMLLAMIEFYQGGPVGLRTLAANISEEQETIEDMYEPYLLQQGFIRRTPRGRVVTDKAYSHLNIKRN